MLGVNPGGAPETHAAETVGSHTHSVLHTLPQDWSAYRDESWKGTPPGTHGMAPRVLHLLRQLGLSPGTVPASNLVFVRSRREGHIHPNDMRAMADACWSFHDRTISLLRPRVVLCFGQTAGKYVRRRLGADRLIGEFTEHNNRRWRSHAFAGSNGINVVVATHPSIANWCVESTDVTPLVEKALQ
jgi:uracil-DNA glycosylase family 4